MQPPFILRIYRLAGDRARTLTTTTLTCSQRDAFAALRAVRSGLPNDCGAALTDQCGRNITEEE